MANKQTLELLNYHDRTGEIAEYYKTAYEFAEKVILPLDPPVPTEEEIKNGTGEIFYHPLWKKMGGQGLLAMNVPKKYGGLEAGFLAQVAITAAIARFSGSTALSQLAGVDLCMGRILEWGNEDQKQEWIPGLADGSMVGALAMSESEAGTDVLSMKTAAIKDGDDYIINGEKTWITNGGVADVIVLYAVTDPTLSKSKRISAFLFDTNTEGFTREHRIKKGGMKRSDTWTLTFQDCRVPKSCLFGAEGQGSEVLRSGLRTERDTLAVMSNEIAQHAYDYALDYNMKRVQFGKPLIENQAVKFKFAEMNSKLRSMRSNAYELAAMYTNGFPLNDQNSSSVFYESGVDGFNIGVNAVLSCGGAGYTTEFPLMQMMNDLMLCRIGGGTDNAKLMAIGNNLAM